MKNASILLITLLMAATTTVAASMHFGLAKSAPEADSSVPSVEAVTLWFTQAPKDNSVSIRLVDAGGDLVETGEPVRAEDDSKSMSISVGDALAAGAYSVAWRGIGDDGHVVNGDFTFTVAAQR